MPDAALADVYANDIVVTKRGARNEVLSCLSNPGIVALQLGQLDVRPGCRGNAAGEWSLARFGGAGTVALGSTVISYGHVQDVLAEWGYGVLASHAGPLVLDGLMVISGFALLAMSRTPPADSLSTRRWFAFSARCASAPRTGCLVVAGPKVRR